MDNMTKLADRIVSLGIAEGPYSDRYNLKSNISWRRTAQIFVTDADTMVAMLDTVRSRGCDAWYMLARMLMDEYCSHDIKLTITTTCVELLEELDNK